MLRRNSYSHHLSAKHYVKKSVENEKSINQKTCIPVSQPPKKRQKRMTLEEKKTEERKDAQDKFLLFLEKEKKEEELPPHTPQPT